MYEELAIGMLVFIVIWLTGIALVAHVLEVRKTKKYRRELGDLYVAAKIKKIAKSDDLDLEVEKELFVAWNKKNRVRDVYQNYDDVVEEEMKEQVVDSLVKKPKK